MTSNDAEDFGNIGLKDECGTTVFSGNEYVQ
jgi:hypothetical protein